MKLCPKKKEKMTSSLAELLKLLVKFEMIELAVTTRERRHSLIRRSIQANTKGRFK